MTVSFPIQYIKKITHEISLCQVCKINLQRNVISRQDKSLTSTTKRVNAQFRDQNIIKRVDPMELNFEVLEVQKCYIPTDRAQKVCAKNGFICLFIIYTPRVMVMKISRMPHFCIFCYFLFSSALSENAMDYSVLRYHLQDFNP